MSGSGAFDTTGLTLINQGNEGTYFIPNEAVLEDGTGQAIDRWTGFTGPTSFGTGAGSSPSNQSGDVVGIFGLDALFFTPSGYASGTDLSFTQTFADLTFTGLGLTPGTYTWTWGGGCSTDQCFTLEISSVPGPVVGTGLPGVILASGGALAWWRRKRKAQAV